ncbi:MAG: hypothetical protein WAQ28_05535 [Bacteroidia bacterium]|jgi:hypothetical protein
MSTEVKVGQHETSKDKTVPLEVAHSNPSKDKHLEGFSEDQKKVIRMMADIFVKNILNLSNK